MRLPDHALRERVVRSVLAISGRELGSMFGRPLAYAVLALFVLLYGLLTLWFDDWLTAGVASMRRPLWWAAACMLLVVPATTMRTFAEEWRSGTWSVLGALPVTPLEVVVGKWLGAVGLLGVALALTLPWPAAMLWLGDPDLGPIVGGYLGLWLATAALAAVGVAASASTDSQVVAFLATFVAGAAPWLVAQTLPLLPPSLVPAVEGMSLDQQLLPLFRGVVDARSLALFGAVIAVGLRAAVHAVERRRLA
jgi:ABC-2 type transport system permease protein